MGFPKNRYANELAHGRKLEDTVHCHMRMGLSMKNMQNWEGGIILMSL